MPLYKMSATGTTRNYVYVVADTFPDAKEKVKADDQIAGEIHYELLNMFRGEDGVFVHAVQEDIKDES